MKKPNSIQFILSTGCYGIPSVNSLYKAKIMYKWGKPIATIYKDTSAKKVIAAMSDQLRMIDFAGKAPWIWEKDAVFDFQIKLLFKQSFFRRDTDNTVKLIQDTISRYLGFNDSRIITVHATKSIYPSLPEEKICVNLSLSTEGIRFDQLDEPPIPERIWIGGNADPSDLVTGLKEARYESVYLGGTTEESENEKDNLCDCHIYLLSPGKDALPHLIDVLDSANEAKFGGYYGSVITGILGTPEEWGDDWTQVEHLRDLIKKSFTGTKKVVIREISDPVELIKDLGKQKRRRKNEIVSRIAEELPV